MKMARWAVLALALWPGGSSSTARGAEFYYAMVFGADASPRKARTAHTWAVYVRAVGEGPDPSTYAIESHVISWLPTTQVVHIYDPHPEPGRNLTIPETFAAVLKYEDQPTMWGPFRIDREHFLRGAAVSATLNSGVTQYRALRPRDLEITNCIHAAADVDKLFGGNVRPGFRYGKPASSLIAEHMAAQALPSPGGGADHRWLIPRLGLDRYPLDVVPAPF